MEQTFCSYRYPLFYLIENQISGIDDTISFLTIRDYSVVTTLSLYDTSWPKTQIPGSHEQQKFQNLTSSLNSEQTEQLEQSEH